MKVLELFKVGDNSIVSLVGNIIFQLQQKVGPTVWVVEGKILCSTSSKELSVERRLNLMETIFLFSNFSDCSKKMISWVSTCIPLPICHCILLEHYLTSFINAPFSASFYIYFCSFQTIYRIKNSIPHWDSNSHCQSRRRARLPLDHHHAPSCYKFIL